VPDGCQDQALRCFLPSWKMVTDWIGTGFGPDLLPESPSLPFILDLRAAAPHPSETDPVKLAVLAAQRIYETSPEPLSLMVSGGIDSQAMAYAFKKSGVPFRAFFVRYEGGFNDHDFLTSDFYREHDIPVEEISLDIVAFHRGGLIEWAHRYRNNSPHFVCHQWIASHLPGRIVSSGVIMRSTEEPISYSSYGLQRYSEISGQPVIGYFLFSDPHFVYETHKPRCVELGNLYVRKVQHYHACGFPVKPQVTKTHGFEKLKEYFDAEPVSVATRVRYKSKPSPRPYDLIFRYPLTDVMSYSENSGVLLPVDK
jgi:hypothetical protein